MGGNMWSTKVLFTIWILWCAALFPSAKVWAISWKPSALPIVPYTLASQLVPRRENNAGDLESVPIEADADHDNLEAGTSLWDSSLENRINVNADTLIPLLSTPSLPSMPAWFRTSDDPVRRKRVLGIEIPDVIAFHQPKSSRVSLPFSMNVSLQNLRKLSQGLHKSGRRR